MAQAPITAEVKTQAARLAQFVSHFHQVLDLGIARGTLAAGARAYYGREVHRPVAPPLRSYDQIAEAAGKIVEGEAARATAEGAAYIPMAMPAARDVGALLTAWLAVRAASQRAQFATNREQEEAGALFGAARELAVEIIDTVEFHYRKDRDPASRRQKCARWGVVYEATRGELPAV